MFPTHVSRGSTKNIWWECEKGHEWQAIINNRTNGRGCPYCSGKRVCADNALSTKYPHLVYEWHPTKNHNLKPEEVTCGSSKKPCGYVKMGMNEKLKYIIEPAVAIVHPVEIEENKLILIFYSLKSLNSSTYMTNIGPLKITYTVNSQVEHLQIFLDTTLILKFLIILISPGIVYLEIVYSVCAIHTLGELWTSAINQIFECSLIGVYICKCNQTVKIENINCVLIAGLYNFLNLCIALANLKPPILIIGELNIKKMRLRNLNRMSMLPLL